MPYKKTELDMTPSALAERMSNLQAAHKKAEGELKTAIAEHARASVQQELKGGSRKLLETSNDEKACADRVADLRRDILGCETLIADAAKNEVAETMAAAIEAVVKIGGQRNKVIAEIETTILTLVELLRTARQLGIDITAVDKVPGSVGAHLRTFPETARQYMDRCFKDVVNGDLVDQAGAGSFNTVFQVHGLHKVESARWANLISEVKALAAEMEEAA